MTLVLSALLLARTSGQAGNSEWVAWARDHAVSVALDSPANDRFDDLQFLKTVLGERRIVQLGESGHGVSEFSTAKIRLIKFLHQQMGFDVIAFESGLYDCYYANAMPSLSADGLMRGCIFNTWYTKENLTLFDYIKQVQRSDRPLTIAGFDTQRSSQSSLSTRPAMFASLVRFIAPDRAAEVERLDTDYLTRGRVASFAIDNEATLTDFYGGLQTLFKENRAYLQTQIGDANLPIVAQQAAASALQELARVRASTLQRTDPNLASLIRDESMADNLTFLANELYPNRKIIVWAHNLHVRQISDDNFIKRRTMGYWVRQRLADQMYTIGLFMNQGSASGPSLIPYSIPPGSPDSLEWILSSAGRPVLFMDFLHQERTSGSSWMFEEIAQRDWGQPPAYLAVPREQYDGVLFIERVKSPLYLPLQ